MLARFSITNAPPRPKVYSKLTHLVRQNVGRLVMTRSRSQFALYPTVAVVIEDLRRQRVALFWTLLLRDVTVHPKALLLQHGDVYLLEVDSIGLEESHHRLLMLLYLKMERREEMTSECCCDHVELTDPSFLGGSPSCSLQKQSILKQSTPGGAEVQTLPPKQDVC